MQKPFNPIWEPIPIEQQSWRTQLANRALAIEIGPGVGLHPILYAQQNSDKLIVGIERTTEKFDKFARRVEHHPQVDNVLAVHADAVEWITKNIRSNEVSEYFLLYPNPYPKESQRNKRLMHMPFMQHLIATMQSGATLTMATNMQFFYQEAKEAWLRVENFNLIDDRILDANQTARTHFERKYLATGQNCYQLIFAKT